MKLKDLISTHHWLSVKSILLATYPDEEEQIDDYQTVYEWLQLSSTKSTDIWIRLTLEESDDELSYVQVDGYHGDHRLDSQGMTDALALEFTPWDEWLSMKIDPTTQKEFSELEIIAHCLYEITFVSFDPEEIKAEIENIKKIADEYKNASAKDKTFSLDEILDNLERKKENPDED